MKLIISFLFVAVIILSACTAKKTTTSSPTDAAIVGEIKRNFTEAQMQEGKTIWENGCARCHKLFQPESRTIAQWENVLPRMYPRAKMDDAQAGKVRAYILTHAKMS